MYVYSVSKHGVILTTKAATLYNIKQRKNVSTHFVRVFFLFLTFGVWSHSNKSYWWIESNNVSLEYGQFWTVLVHLVFSYEILLLKVQFSSVISSRWISHLCISFWILSLIISLISFGKENPCRSFFCSLKTTMLKFEGIVNCDEKRK